MDNSKHASENTSGNFKLVSHGHTVERKCSFVYECNNEEFLDQLMLMLNRFENEFDGKTSFVYED